MNTGYRMNSKKKESRISVICDNNVFSLTLIKVKEKTVNQKIVNQKTVNQKAVNQITVIRNIFPNDNKTLKQSNHDLLKNKLKYKDI
jgi:hypothetical protein